MAYLGIYLAAEVLAAGIDARLGLVVHAGLLLAIFFHGANVPPGPERTFFWTLWLAPLTRIYGLAQPYRRRATADLVGADDHPDGRGWRRRHAAGRA